MELQVPIMNGLACLRLRKGTVPQREEAAEMWRTQQQDHSHRHRISHPTQHAIDVQTQIFGPV